MRQVTVTPESCSSAFSGTERRLAAVIDCLITARHETGDRTRDQNAAARAGAHLIADSMNETNRPVDVGVRDAQRRLEILIEKGTTQPTPGVGQQRIDFGSG